MMRRLAAVLLFVPIASAQEPPTSADLWARCGSQIAWLTDGVVLADGESVGIGRPSKPTANRAELFDQAVKKSGEVKRLVMWYVPRTSGGHMNRAALLDNYLKAVAWTDPDVVELVRRKFVPLRMSLDRATATKLGFKTFEVVEPGILFLNEKGEVVHVMERLRTFSSDWIVDALVRVLKANPAFNETKASRADELLMGGDWEAAVKAADATPKGRLTAAKALRRLRKADECAKALDAAEPEGAAVERGRLLLNQEKYGDARKVLEKAKGPEALYWIAWLDWHSGREQDARKGWAKLGADHSESPWAWRAAGNLVKAGDTNPDGPITHEFEEVAWWPDTEGLPRRTMHSRAEKDFNDAVKRAIAWLIRHQRSDGSWTDSRYVMCPDPRILPNVFVAVAALGATALLEWRDVDPAACDAAREKAEKYILDESKMNRKNNEEIYADGYRVLYFARKAMATKGDEKAAALKHAAQIAGKLAATQNKQGNWAHEYPNPFCTAAVAWCLQQGRAAGAEIDETMIEKAVTSLKASRGPEGRQPYSAGRKASGAKDSSARNAICDAVLFGAKEIDAAALDGTVTMYWTWMKNSETVRTCDFHSDGELGGFFFWHGFYHTTEAAALLPGGQAEAHLAKARIHALSIAEWDGSFIDSHELGKGYGTAMGLLSLRRTGPPRSMDKR